MFKKAAKSTQKAEKEMDNLFKPPKIKPHREIKSHQREKDDIERVFSLSTIPSKRKTMYRVILALPEHILAQNAYLVAEAVLPCLLEGKRPDHLFYAVLDKLVRVPGTHQLLVNYMLAVNCMKVGTSRTSDGEDEYSRFLISKIPAVVAANKSDILPSVSSEKTRSRIQALKEQGRRVLKLASVDRIRFIEEHDAMK